MRTVVKTYRFKLYQSKKNKHLNDSIDIAASVWNYCIAMHRHYYRAFGKHLSANRLMKHITNGFGSTEVSLSVVPIKGRDVDSPLPRTLRFRHAESCKTGSASRLVEAESHSISTVGVRQETICALDTMLNYQA